MAGERERGGRDRKDREERDSEFVDKLVHINRVAKVTKGGRTFGFAALVVVGDQKGRVGFGHGKAREVPEAIRKATEAAKRGVVRVPLREGRTLHHDVAGRHGAGKVYLRAAPPGTGIIAGGPMRAVFETLGISDVVAKSIGSRNPHNMVKATFEALGRVSSPDLPGLYACADVFALCCRSRWGGLEQEGFGIVLLEAAAAGIPSVAGDSGGVAEAVVDNETGFVIQNPSDVFGVADAIDRLISDSALASRQGQAARHRAETEFAYDVLVSRLADAIDHMGAGALP